MKKVLVFGTFDGIHKGHLDFFKQAKKYGDYLIVVVGRDETVKRIKNRYPQKKERDRLKNLKDREVADKILLGDKNDPYRIIRKLKPDVICLGYDQSSFTKNLKKEVGRLKTKIHRLKAYKPKKYHSSKLNHA